MFHLTSLAYVVYQTFVRLIIILTIWPYVISSYFRLFLAALCKCHATQRWFWGNLASFGCIAIVECTVLLYLSTILWYCFIQSLLSWFKASNILYKLYVNVSFCINRSIVCACVEVWIVLILCSLIHLKNYCDRKLDYSSEYSFFGFPSFSNINCNPLIIYDGDRFLIGMTDATFVKLSIAHNPYLIPSTPSLASTSIISVSNSNLAPGETQLLVLLYSNLNLYIFEFIQIVFDMLKSNIWFLFNCNVIGFVCSSEISVVGICLIIDSIIYK